MFQWLILVLTTAVSAGLIPLVIMFCKKYQLYDPVNARKIHSGNIPRLGGVAIFISFVIAVLVYSLTLKGISLSRSIPLLVSGLLIFGFGFLDDLFEFHAISKLIVQLVAVTIVVAFGYRFKSIFGWELPLWCSLILTFGWVLGIINAYNLIDGLDGLCGSLSFTTLVTIGVSQMTSGDPTGIVCLYLAAAVLGFLIFNWPPAKIFMGDCGSQFLGFMIAVIALYDSNTGFEYNKFFFMLVLVSIPMLDTIAAIWRRLRDHRPIMSADRMHLHHKLLNLGLGKREALYVILVFQVCLCLSMGCTVYVGRSRGTILILVTYMFIIAAFCMLHYLHRAVLRKHGQYGQAVADFSSEAGSKASESAAPSDSSVPSDNKSE